jgi:predicted outer membrane repeat protein
VSSSTFTKNVAGYGGAVYANGGGVVMTANTFTTNTAKVLGGAVFSMGSTAANFDASTGNSFVGNRAPSGSGGGAIWICGDLSTAMSHFRATNTLRGNSSPDIYNPSC